MIGNKYIIDGAIVYNCAGGDYMTLKINDAKIKFKKTNIAYDASVLGLKDMDVSESDSDDEDDESSSENSEESSSE